MIEAQEFLPLGSVVSLEGNPKKMMVIGRALIVDGENGREYYDYGFCLYPEGMLGDAVIYSNHENIAEVHAKGFSNEDDMQAVSLINETLAGLDVPKADPQPISAW